MTEIKRKWYIKEDLKNMAKAWTDFEIGFEFNCFKVYACSI